MHYYQHKHTVADAHAASYTDYTSSDDTIIFSRQNLLKSFIDSQATLPDQGGNTACHSGAGGWQRNLSLHEQMMVAMGTRSASGGLQNSPFRLVLHVWELSNKQKSRTTYIS